MIYQIALCWKIMSDASPLQFFVLVSNCYMFTRYHYYPRQEIRQLAKYHSNISLFSSCEFISFLHLSLSRSQFKQKKLFLTLTSKKKRRKNAMERFSMYEQRSQFRNSTRIQNRKKKEDAFRHIARVAVPPRLQLRDAV